MANEDPLMETRYRNIHRGVMFKMWLGVAVGTLLSIAAAIVFINPLFVVGFFASLLIAGFATSRAMNRCDCPQCGGKLESSGCVTMDGLVRYTCKPCRIHWLSPAIRIDSGSGA